ncbi:hypothetical protein [Thiofaba sp. EF100]|uniref:hypothetical protein n=1 Tax=Thiofaba sp. EF100 TaxID=3121274 RepID=UPI003221A1E9
MLDPIIIIGIGEIGAVLARGLLRLGHPVYPVNRDMPLATAHTLNPEPQAVILAVGEADLQTCLRDMPTPWRDRLVLLQNELLPRDWESHGLTHPTIMSVWFEKKKGQDSKPLLPSPVYGPHAGLIVRAMAKVDLPAREVGDMDTLLWELVRKNVYILTTNICGLVTGGTVEELWREHEALAREVASDVIDLQEWLSGRNFDRERLLQGMLEGFAGDPAHKCMGRSAPARLARALALADQAGLAVPALRRVAQTSG